MLRVGIAAPLAALAVTLGCGYIGPVLPPSPQIPDAVTDVAAVERGQDIVISFTAPIRTTDDLVIARFSNIDLRIGRDLAPFDFEKWASTARPIPITTTPEIDPNDPRPARITEMLPVSDWAGQHVVVAVRTAVKTKDHVSAWSNRAILNVIAPLQPPQAKATPTARGILLNWGPVPNAAGYHVYRQQGSQPPTELGTSSTPDYLDTTSQYDVPYAYTVVAVRGGAESVPSKPVEITASDVFAPSVPGSITALAAPGSIEVSWQRSTESDLKGYFVYRSVNGGPFGRLGGLIAFPTYSDHDVQRGNTYRYAVSAVDQKGNESAKSAPAEAAF